MTLSSIGKQRRIEKLFTKNKTMIVPVDDSLIIGPKDNLLDLKKTIKTISLGRPNGIMGFKETAEIMAENSISVPFIYNLTASTILNSHTKKTVISSVENALIAGADCVAAHINFSSCYEGEMLKNFSTIASECDRLGIPLLAIAYPRKEIDGKDYNYNDIKDIEPSEYEALIAHCVRVVCELGADIVKTQYTGSVESFRKVITSACGKPVIIAGGPKESVEMSLERVAMSIDAGGSGVSFGRNVFNAEHIIPYMNAIKGIVFNQNSYQDAVLNYYAEVGGKI